MRLLRRLVLETAERVADGSGGYGEDWVPLGVVWADVRPRGGREDFVAGRPRPRVKYRILVRAAPVGCAVAAAAAAAVAGRGAGLPAS